MYRISKQTQSHVVLVNVLEKCQSGDLKFVYTYENTVNCKSDYLLLQMFIGNRLA
jgi:hypothetical protein